MLQAGGPSAGAVDSALARVLARPEFAGPGESSLVATLRRALARLWKPVADLLRRLFPHLQFGDGATGIYGRVALLLLALAGAALLAYLAWLVYRNRRGKLLRALDGGGAAPPPQSAVEWEARARAAGAQGLWREAALALYQAVLHRLSDGGALRLDPCKTPGDYRREARRQRQVGPSLDGFLAGFEPVAFGRGRGDSDAYARLQRLALELGAHG